jgi:hypothetical protein
VSGTPVGGGILGPANPLTVADLIYKAHRIAGVLTGAGRGVSVSEAADGLGTLNAMLGSWRTERLMVWGVLRSEWPLTANKQDYVIGQDGTPDFSTDAPERIERAGLIYVGTSPVTEVPLHVILNEQEWQTVTTKRMASLYPDSIYYQQTPPNGLITLWPVQTSSSTLVLYLWQTVTEFVSLSQDVLLPSGYRKAIEYNLAVEIAAIYPTRQHLSPMALQQAAQSKANIKAINKRPSLVRVERAAMGVTRTDGRYNPITNSYS